MGDFLIRGNMNSEEYRSIRQEASTTPGQRQKHISRSPPSLPPLKSWAIGWLRCRADGITGKLSVGRCWAGRLLAQGGGSLGDALWVTKGICPQRGASCCCPPGAAGSPRLEGCQRRAHQNLEESFLSFAVLPGPSTSKAH